MNFNDFALIPKADYKDACDAIREKTDKTDDIVSGEMGGLIRGITSGGMTASIFVTGLSESDTVTATKDGKTINGVWVTKEGSVATQVPVMNSNTTPAGVASAKSEYDTGYAWKAFDGNSTHTTFAHSTKDDANGWWIAYDFGYEVEVSSIEIAPQQNDAGYVFWSRLAKEFTLQGSNDGATWTDIQKFSKPDEYLGTSSGSLTIPLAILSYDVDEPKTFSRFRLVWTTVEDSEYASCSYLQFYGTTPRIVSGHEIANIPDKGTWTVSATNGEQTATQDVLVDGAFEYEIEMTYVLWLYREGDECEDVTGGWVQIPHSTAAYVYAATKESNRFSFALSGGTYTIGTTKLIDLTNYKKLYVDIESTGTVPGPSIGIVNVWDSSDPSAVNVIPYAAGRQTVALDLSEVSETYYVFAVDSSSTTAGYVYNVWLET